MPRFRCRPEDFRVEERPLYEPTGDGPFLWLWTEKTGLDTADVGRELAQALDLPRREVGWAGRKDRHAVTRQAFTVPAAAEARLPSLELEGFEILEVDRTAERLRTGQLLGNRFDLRVQDVDTASFEAASQMLGILLERGLPNRFGAQRYGRDGRNAERGRRLLAAGSHRGDRRRSFLMISALQSQVFDAVLARRPHDELWPGDLVVRHATGDWRWVDRVDDFAAALDAFEISPTGPIFGTKTKRARGRAAELEAEVMRELDLPPVEQMRLPKGLRLFGDRRALRVLPQETQLTHDPATRTARFCFALPAGSYATVLLESLFPEGLQEGPA